MCLCQYYISLGWKAYGCCYYYCYVFFFLVPQIEDSVVTFRKTLGQQRVEKKLGQQETIRRKDS